MRVQGQGGIDTTKWYRLIAKHSGKCLDMQGANLVNGSNLNQFDCHLGDNQKFQFRSVGDGYYRIVIGHSRRCIDQLGAVFTDGARIVQFFCHDGQNQQWLPIPDGTGHYQFRVRHSGKNMDVQGFSFANGAQVVQYIPHGADNQQFRLEEVPPPCPDNDNDTYCTTFDCDDNDPLTYPGAPIACESGRDRNCNGMDDFSECEGPPEP